MSDGLNLYRIMRPCWPELEVGEVYAGRPWWRDPTNSVLLHRRERDGKTMLDMVVPLSAVSVEEKPLARVMTELWDKALAEGDHACHRRSGYACRCVPEIGQRMLNLLRERGYDVVRREAS